MFDFFRKCEVCGSRFNKKYIYTVPSKLKEKSKYTKKLEPLIKEQLEYDGKKVCHFCATQLLNIAWDYAKMVVDLEVADIVKDQTS